MASWAPCNETFCLFNVSSDPCEHHDLSQVLEMMDFALKMMDFALKMMNCV